MCRGSLPLDRAGTHALPKLPEREMVTHFLGHNQLGEEYLKEHFSVMFQQFLSGLVNKDYSKIEKITEKRFFEKLQGQKDDLNRF